MENTKKDFWDKFQSVSAVLVPAAIAFCGYSFTQAQQEIEIASAREIASKQETIARLQARVGQAEAVVSFIKSLLSANVQERQLAIEAVLIALPDEGPRLVKIISTSDSDPEVKRFAARAYEQRAGALVESLLSEDPRKSDAAAAEFARAYVNDPAQVKLLLESAEGERPEHVKHNAIQALQAAPSQALRPNKEEWDEFIRKVGTNATAIRGPVEMIQRKL